MIHGYVLINALLGKTFDVTKEVSKVKGIKKTCAVTGSYDIIGIFEVEKLSDIGDVVIKEIQDIIGVYSTQTVVCVSCKLS